MYVYQIPDFVIFIVAQFVELGIVTSIEVNHKQVETARKGQEVCIKIEPIPGDSPKMFGRHFDENDFLISKVSLLKKPACIIFYWSWIKICEGRFVRR